MMPRKRSKKEHEVNGSRNLHSRRSWSRAEEMKIWDAAQNSCGKAFITIRDSRWEKFKEECRVKRKSSEWCLGTIREAYEKTVKEAGRWEDCTGNLEKKHGFPEAHHCTNRWKGRSYLVVHLPALHLFSSEGLSLVGIDGDKALQLVVCNLWRKI